MTLSLKKVEILRNQSQEELALPLGVNQTLDFSQIC